MQLYNASFTQMQRNLRDLEILRLKTGIYDVEWKHYTMLTSKQSTESVDLLSPEEMSSVIMSKLLGSE